MNKYGLEKGKILCAEPFMIDSEFKRSVILLTEFDKKKGAAGFIINKLLPYALHEILEFGFPSFEAQISDGGPVQRSRLYFIHNKPQIFTNTIAINHNLYWHGDIDELKTAVLQQKIKPENIRFFIGYTGWDYEQLLDEMEAKSWIVCDYKYEYLFHNEQYLWKKILSDQSGTLQVVSEIDDYEFMN
jgi:putative transcriptional regulator